jgi:hypothetical protein
VNHRRSNKNIRETKGAMSTGGTHRRDRKTQPFATIMDEGREAAGEWTDESIPVSEVVW